MERVEQDKVKNGWVVITGATGSMGSVAARQMAAEGYRVILACRNLSKGQELMDSIKATNHGAVLELRELNLGSLASVKRFAEGLEGTRISAIFNNAGTMARRYSLSAEGIEMDMAVNYLNQAVLCMLLAPRMEPGSRIVNMVSVSTKFAHLDQYWRKRGEEDFGQLKTYSMSKLAFLYFSVALARKFPELYVNVADPGVVNSNMITMGRWFDPLADILFRPLISSPQKGVVPALAALHTSGSGLYFVGKRSRRIPRRYTEDTMVDYTWNEATRYLRNNNN